MMATDPAFLKIPCVSKMSSESSKNINESLYAHIYYESNTNQSALAKSLGIQRQTLNGIIHKKLKCSIPLAQKICKKLGVKNIHTLFKQTDLYYPEFQTADKIQGGIQ